MNDQEIIRVVASTSDPLWLATVVDVEGSSYRRPGARMLILPDGERIGSISGGCLERDLCQQAPRLTSTGPRLVSFDTRSGAVHSRQRYNLGCQGIIYVLVERVTRGEDCPLRFVRQSIADETQILVATTYQTDQPGLLPIGRRLTDAEFPELRREFERTAPERALSCQLLRHGVPVGRVFLERLNPPKSFWIFGAGDDAMPLAKVASELGWQVTVVDDVARNLTEARFPTASRLLYAKSNTVSERLDVTPDTAAILVTHRIESDAVLLPWLLSLKLSYLGMLGPKTRASQLLQRLYANNKLPPPISLDSLHTPVGLDIGAHNAAEIAVAIVAEVVAKDRNRLGGFLGDRKEPIHPPVTYRRFELKSPIEPRKGVPPTDKIAAIVLAAGGSSRFGQPKQLVEYAGASLLQRAVTQANASVSGPVVTVVGANAKIVRQNVEQLPTLIAVNEDWREGLGGSVAVGMRFLLERLPSVSAVLLILCDQPQVSEQHLRSLVQRVKSGIHSIASTAYEDGSPGVPAVFAAEHFEKLIVLSGEKGAKRILEQIPHESIQAAGELRDIDTPEDLRQLDESQAG